MDHLRVVRVSKALVAALLLVAIALLVGFLESRFARTEQALRSNPPSTVFQRPLPCDAIVAQRGAGEPFVSRCYYFSDKGKQ